MSSCLASTKPALTDSALAACGFDAANNCITNVDTKVTRSAQCYQVLPGVDPSAASYDLTDTTKFKPVDSSLCSGPLDIYSYADDQKAAIKGDTPGVPCLSLKCSETAHSTCAPPVYAYGVGAFDAGAAPPSCSGHGTYSSQTQQCACDDGWSGPKCATKSGSAAVCKCGNGVAASGADCPATGVEVCTSCNAGYVLQDGACKPKAAPSGMCTGCVGSSSGPCKAADNVCSDYITGTQCSPGTTPC